MKALSGLMSVAFFAAVFAGAIQGLGIAFGKGANTAPQEVPFLGGASPEVHAWQRYHVRYYSMALLFIAFEMEMMFMYPWAAVFVEEGVKAMVEMGMFLGILSVGILYGWREGIFRWQ